MHVCVTLSIHTYTHIHTRIHAPTHMTKQGHQPPHHGDANPHHHLDRQIRHQSLNKIIHSCFKCNSGGQVNARSALWTMQGCDTLLKTRIAEVDNNDLIQHFNSIAHPIHKCAALQPSIPGPRPPPLWSSSRLRHLSTASARLGASSSKSFRRSSRSAHSRSERRLRFKYSRCSSSVLL